MGLNLGTFIATGTQAGAQVAGALPSSSPGSNQPAIATLGTFSGLAATAGAAGVAAAGGVASVSATAAGGGLLGAGAAALNALPIVGSIIAGLAIIALKIFKGADPRQVPASKIVETFNVAKRLIGYAYMHGMIDREQALQGIEYLHQVGLQLYQKNAAALGSTITQNSIINLENGIVTSINAINSYTPTLQESLDVSQVPGWSIEINPYTGAKDGRNIYPESVAAGYGLAQEYLKAVGSNPISQAVSTVSGLIDKAAASVGIKSSSLKTLGLAAIGVLLVKRFLI